MEPERIKKGHRYFELRIGFLAILSGVLYTIYEYYFQIDTGVGQWIVFLGFIEFATVYMYSPEIKINPFNREGVEKKYEFIDKYIVLFIIMTLLMYLIMTVFHIHI